MEFPFLASFLDMVEFLKPSLQQLIKTQGAKLARKHFWTMGKKTIPIVPKTPFSFL